MKYLDFKLVLPILILVCFSCKKGDNECQNAVRPLSMVFTELLSAPDYSESITYDTRTHEYTFFLSQNGTLCSIGYQGQPNISAYRIELLDAQGNILLQDDLSFSSSHTEYVNVTPTDLLSGNSYTLRRTCLQCQWSIGRILQEENSTIGSDTLTLPIGNDLITITGVYFYGNGGPLNNAVPFIDFGFIKK